MARNERSSIQRRVEAQPEAKVIPQTVRGVRTRDALVRAARDVFERDGYLDARITDITRLANCATGSFYTYFEDKRDVFTAVLASAEDEMLHLEVPKIQVGDDPVALIEVSNRAYFEAYRRNARLMALLEQVAQLDSEFREVRTARSRAFVDRNARSIADLQSRALADPELSPVMASRGLSAMVSRLAYQSFVLGDEVPFEELVSSATTLWVNALGMKRTAASAGPQRDRPQSDG